MGLTVQSDNPSGGPGTLATDKVRAHSAAAGMSHTTAAHGSRHAQEPRQATLARMRLAAGRCACGAACACSSRLPFGRGTRCGVEVFGGRWRAPPGLAAAARVCNPVTSDAGTPCMRACSAHAGIPKRSCASHVEASAAAGMACLVANAWRACGVRRRGRGAGRASLRAHGALSRSQHYPAAPEDKVASFRHAHQAARSLSRWR